MNKDLYNLLSEICLNGDSKHTHITKAGGEKKWTVDQANKLRFWEELCKIVANDSDNSMNIYEVPDTKELPIIVDLLLKFDNVSSIVTPFPDKALEGVVMCFQTAITELCKVEEEEDNLSCVVLESKMWCEDSVTGTIIKDNVSQCGNLGLESKTPTKNKSYLAIKVRLQFALNRIDVNFQNQHILKRAIELMRVYNIAKYMNSQPIGDWYSIVSLASSGQPVLMYGSTEKLNQPKMFFYKFWGKVPIESFTNPDECKDEVCELDLDMLRLSNHIDITKGLFEEDDLSDANQDADHWLPMILSLGYGKAVTLPLSKSSVSKNVASIRYDKGDVPEIEIAEHLLSIVNLQRRFSDLSNWSDMGHALHTCKDAEENRGTHQGLAIWTRHTEKFCKSQDRDIRLKNISETYSKFNNNNIGLKTIAFFAREDNRASYDSWHEAWLASSMRKAISGTHTDVAEALYRHDWLNWLCTGDKNYWFQYREKSHRWVGIGTKGIDLSRIISSTFVKRFETMRTNWSREVQESDDEYFRAAGEESIKQCTRLIFNLKKVPFKRSIMTEVTEFFHHSTLCDIMDMNPFVMGIQDGVIDVSGNKAIVRPGKPEDYISKQSTVGLQTKYDWKHPLVLEVMEWLEKVFPNKSLRDHFIKYVSSCMRGRNSDKLFPILTGEGDNGKSMIIKALELLFGQYCIKFPTSIITGKRTQSSSAMPELARARAAKIAIVQEPGPNEQMQPGPVKELTGGDSMYQRGLYAEGGDMVMMLKLLCMSNKVPVVLNADKAIKNRIRIFPFKSTWSDNAPQDIKEQYAKRIFKKDPFFEARIPHFAGAFLWIIVQYFEIYIKEGMGTNKEIDEATSEYWQEHDIYRCFFSETIKEARTIDGKIDVNSKLHISDIYREFKQWFKDCFPQAKIPNRNVVKAAVEEIMKVKVDHSWVGIKFANEDSIKNQVL